MEYASKSHRTTFVIMPRPPVPTPRSSSDGFQSDQTGSTGHYHDIESATLTTLSRNRQKTSKDRGKQQSSIWSTTESEKSSKKSKRKHEKSSKSDDDKEKTFLANPIFEHELRNWTLPRVELWCRDPTCIYNKQLWGSHYTTQHPNFPGTHSQSRKDETFNHQNEEEQITVSSSASNPHYYNSPSIPNHFHHSKSQSQEIPQHDISINSVPMVLTNSHRSDGAKGSRSGHSQQSSTIHRNMSLGMNNLNTKDGGFSNTTKAVNNFTSSSVIPLSPRNTNNTEGSMAMTMTHTDTIASSITTHSSTNTSNTDTTILTIHTGGISSGSRASGGISSPEGSASTFVTGFESSSSAIGSQPVDHDIADYKTLSRTGPTNVYSNTVSSGYPSLYTNPQGFRTPSAASTNPYCPNCSGVVPLNHLDNSDVARLKGDAGFWNFNKFQHPLQRDHSFHSVGGFTLNGQYNTNVKKHTMLKFCSSHKISLVVSTFSLLVTIGLLITLFLMKQRGMMDTMSMNLKEKLS